MPGRLLSFVNGNYYHVFNRGIDHRPIFLNNWEFDHAIKAINYYRYEKLPLRLSLFLIWKKELKEEFFEKLNNKDSLVNIISYCLMPNHFHFLLRQNKDNGISKFLSKFQNSYTKFFNSKHQRTGPLLLDQFKAVEIITEEQLIHVSRYIHLNPYSSGIVKKHKELENYKWSSLSEYLFNSSGICEKEIIFSRMITQENYRKFVLNHAEYQKELDRIKHLILD